LCDFASVPSNTPCGSFTFGECEDYNFEVIAATPCSGQPTAGVITGNSPICPNTAFNLGVSGNTTAGSMTYTWLSSTVSANGPYTIVPGANGPYLNSNGITQDTWYKSVIGCTPSGLTDTTAPFLMAVAGFYNCYGNNSAATYIYDEDIFNVSLTNINNTTACSQTYSDFRNSIAPAKLSKTLTYPLGLTLGTCG